MSTNRVPRPDFQDEHIASRKDWGAYVDLTTTLHRKTVAQVDEFLAQLRARLERVLGQKP